MKKNLRKKKMVELLNPSEAKTPKFPKESSVPSTFKWNINQYYEAASYMTKEEFASA